jgi:nucleotide-binding universal stress UspA family protein
MAASRRTSLDIVTALPPFEELTFWYPDAALDVDLVGVRQGQIEEDLKGHADSLRTKFPGLPVTTVVEVGSPQTLLAGRTRSSQLTVLGTRGRGAVASVLLGSVSRSVLFHAEGPVMIVPTGETPAA